MALRRLFSGWLGALAALARSVAQALEHAAEDRSAPAPNPVMDALAERYPGAPAHWLAHVAERTSQLAEAGEVPLSLNSDPATWPPTQPQASPPPVETMARAPVSRDPAPTGPSSRREAAVPTLAALRERPSETWRRPDLVPKRRSRPVFASPVSTVRSEPSAHAAPGPSADAVRRPRSPLSVRADMPSRPTSETSRATGSEATAPPEEIVRQAAWADAPRNLVEGPGTAPVRPITTPSMGADPSVRTGAEERAIRDPGAHADRTRPTILSRDPRPSTLGRVVQRPVRVARFLAPRPKPVKRAEVADAWTVDRGGAVEHGSAARVAGPSPSSPRAIRDLTPSAVHASLPHPPGLIFRALAAVQARSRAKRVPAADPTVRSTPPTAGLTSVDAPWRASSAGSEPPIAPVPARLAPAVPRRGHGESTAPVRTAQPRTRRVGHEGAAVERTALALNGQTTERVKRPTFTPSGAASPKGFTHGLANSPPEDRWPSLPPATFASPQGVAAPPPRWEDLAREQEEGRWNV